MKYWIVKVEKSTGRIVGALSQGGRRWLDLVSTKHQKLEADKDVMEKKLKKYDQIYGWQTNYGYKYELKEVE